MRGEFRGASKAALLTLVLANAVVRPVSDELSLSHSQKATARLDAANAGLQDLFVCVRGTKLTNKITTSISI